MFLSISLLTDEINDCVKGKDELTLLEETFIIEPLGKKVSLTLAVRALLYDSWKGSRLVLTIRDMSLGVKVVKADRRLEFNFWVL